MAQETKTPEAFMIGQKLLLGTGLPLSGPPLNNDCAWELKGRLDPVGEDTLLTIQTLPYCAMCRNLTVDFIHKPAQ